jgi:hypothetical protein
VIGIDTVVDTVVVIETVVVTVITMMTMVVIAMPGIIATENGQGRIIGITITEILSNKFNQSPRYSQSNQYHRLYRQIRA